MEGVLRREKPARLAHLIPWRLLSLQQDLAKGGVKLLSVNCHCYSVTKLCLTLCDPRDCTMPGFPVLHYLPEFAQTHVHWISDAIQPSHLLSSPSPSTYTLSQHQGLFQWVDSSHQVVKVLELQLQHQSFQWINKKKKPGFYLFYFFVSSFFLFPWPWETWIFSLLKGGSVCLCMWASRKTSSSAVGSRLPGQPLTAELTGSTSAF